MIGLRRSKPGSRELGALGEKRAAEFLEKDGYTIRDRNFRCQIGEIDIIAEKSEYIVFVEVKSRSGSTRRISPFISMTKRKIGTIQKVGQLYMLKNKVKDRQPRFDVIGVVFESRRQFTVEHIKNAF